IELARRIVKHNDELHKSRLELELRITDLKKISMSAGSKKTTLSKRYGAGRPIGRRPFPG
ncbi:hypothetical protein M1M87_02155, partial [Thermodesulfovibrionales bacterium]|nr:hypothetical protein [Thermodesulfovibrionales bacterium]